MKLSKSDERLRQDSPAYRPDDEWEALEPQGMQVVLSVRFDAGSARRITDVARRTGRTPSRLIRDWTLERVASLSGEDRLAGAAGIREAAANYASSDDDFERLRDQYRPAKIEILLVGESRPAGGTFFYLANSNLFYATREAFQAAFGPMPSGEGFLLSLRERGVWLFDLANQPVDQLPGRPRRAAVQARVGGLAQLLREARPRLVIAIKRDLAAAVRQAMDDVDLLKDRLHVLPFPLYQWRRDYVSGLTALLKGDPTREAESAGTDSPRKSTPALHTDRVTLPTAERLLSELIDKPLHTLTGSPNRIVRVVGDRVIVATDRSPSGQPVPIADVQYALDELTRIGDLRIDVDTVGRRSAFIGAVLQTLPGAEATLRPRRIRLPGLGPQDMDRRHRSER